MHRLAPLRALRAAMHAAAVLIVFSPLIITPAQVYSTPAAGNASAHLVRDIYPGAGGSDPAGLVGSGGTLFFSANDGANGRELWRSDGTADGTLLVEDLAPGQLTAFNTGLPPHLVDIAGTVFFSCSLRDTGIELCRSDGTAEGTTLVKNIAQGMGNLANSSPEALTSFKGALFFQAFDETHGRELWRSDGTPDGTALVADIAPGYAFSQPHGLVVVRDTLFFTAFGSNELGRELWKTDGTAEGTVLVKDIQPGRGSGDPTSPTRLGHHLFFAADDGVNGRELWKSDGTPDGTVTVVDINPSGSGIAFSAPRMATVGGTLYFVGDDGVHGPELWRSDGSAAGTAMVMDISPGAAGSSLADLTTVGGTLFFTADDGVHGLELWTSDGTEAGTRLVKDVKSAGASNPYKLTDVNGVVFFTADDGKSGRELWRSDGTSAGTSMVHDVASGAASSNPSSITLVGNVIFFNADDGIHGPELWATRAPVGRYTATIPAITRSYPAP